MSEIDKSQNEEKLKKIIAKYLGIKKEKIELSTLITNTAETRPFGKLFELYAKIEKEFDIKVPVEDMTKIKTVLNCLNYINYHQEN
ncbi:hypothetical protein RB653_000223 [Dictyostelium firmibasis]|uniref:Carrier domain-containing protein n=1 Tax=Dictyostelium firmibasis TaxID=79012 RepID=A0AAN7U2I4_9MYCE